MDIDHASQQHQGGAIIPDFSRLAVASHHCRVCEAKPNNMPCDILRERGRGRFTSSLLVKDTRVHRSAIGKRPLLFRITIHVHYRGERVRLNKHVATTSTTRAARGEKKANKQINMKQEKIIQEKKQADSAPELHPMVDRNARLS